MKFSIKTKLRAKKEMVRQIDSKHLEVSVTQPPLDGKANEAVIKALVSYFNLPKNHISIVSGLKSKMKVVEVL